MAVVDLFLAIEWNAAGVQWDFDLCHLSLASPSKHEELVYFQPTKTCPVVSAWFNFCGDKNPCPLMCIAMSGNVQAQLYPSGRGSDGIGTSVCTCQFERL